MTGLRANLSTVWCGKGEGGVTCLSKLEKRRYKTQYAT